jgi:Germination protease.
MTEHNNYIRTDLAAEFKTNDGSNLKGVDFIKRKYGNVTAAELTIDDTESAEILSKPLGRYITVSFEKLWLCGDDEINHVVSVISSELKMLVNKTAGNPKSILIAGLGNQYITTDSVGPQSVKNINVTRHIKEHDEILFEKMDCLDISSIAPGVVGQTGIETLELIKGAVNNVKPSLLIVIDALAARSIDRLAVTIQLTDSGISPGSGIGNKRRAINQSELGIPVIAIGVPTVVDSSTLVYDALEQAGITDLSNELVRVLENGRSFFVSLKESDLAVTELAHVISRAINEAFSIK